VAVGVEEVELEDEESGELEKVLDNERVQAVETVLDDVEDALAEFVTPDAIADKDEYAVDVDEPVEAGVDDDFTDAEVDTVTELEVDCERDAIAEDVAVTD
jgi:hypothetical protein